MKPIKLILVESDRRLRKAIARMLSDSQRIVIVDAVDCYYALLYLISDDGCGFHPDVVVMDLDLPDRNRFHADAVCVHLCETRLVLLSSRRPDDAAKSTAKSYGATDLLDKNDLRTLISTIEFSVQSN
jgi:DNA-binding response OmpR family regulator